MSSSQPDEEAPASGPPRSYNFIAATYRERKYPGGVLLLDPERKEMELRETTGKGRRRVETVIARFRVERAAQLTVEGAVLTVSQLSITLEPPGAAQEVADLLRRPTFAEMERAKRLLDAESSVRAFLGQRDDAMGFLKRVKADPRSALIGKRSMWPEDETREPLDAISEGYSTLLYESLESVKASLSVAEKSLGSPLTGRLCALAYTVAAVQDALLDDDSDLTQELAALQELGISTTAEDLRMEKTTERLVLQAHPALEALAASAQTG